MIKSLSAFAIFALLASAVVAIPGFTPIAQASETTPLAKSDRLDIVVSQPCGQQAWPNLASSCLRTTSNREVHEARLVTAERR